VNAEELQLLLMYLLAFIVAVTFHEFAHAYVADRLGDDTPRLSGRITINPLDHLDPVGTFVLIVTAAAGFAFGWGRPVLVAKSRFKNPKTGHVLVSAAGPLMNLLLAMISAVVVRTGYFGLPNVSPWHRFIVINLDLNVLLFVFNLIPVPPLDGAHILADILPEDMSRAYHALMGKWSWVLFFVVLYFGGRLIAPTVDQIHIWLANSS
jgi:Zn-dependent protease